MQQNLWCSLLLVLVFLAQGASSWKLSQDWRDFETRTAIAFIQDVFISAISNNELQFWSNKK